MTDETINLPPLVGTLTTLTKETQSVVLEYGKACARAAVLADRQSPEVVEMRDMLKEARQQLPLAAQFWNEDDVPERGSRNVKLVMELIAKIDAAMEAES